MTELTETADPAADKVLPLNRKPRAGKNSLRLEEQGRRRLEIVCESGVNQDDVRTIDFWFNVAPGLRRLDIVILWAADRSWEMETCIERVRGDGCEISVRKVYGHTSENDASEPADDEGKYRVEYRGPQQWCVRRVADDALVQKGHPQKSGALAAFRAAMPRKAA